VPTDIPGFWRHAAAHPDQTATIAADGTELTYGRLAAWTNRISNAFAAAGLGPGDTVAGLLRNSPAFLAVNLAALQSGLYFTPINGHLTGGEAGYILGDCGAAYLVTDARLADTAIAAAEAAGFARSRVLTATPDARLRDLDDFLAGAPDTAPERRTAGQILLYSSGTTGKPKGIRKTLSGGSPEDQAQWFGGRYAEHYGLEAGRGVHLAVAPLYHSAPNAQAIGVLHLGHTVVLADRFDARRTLELVAAYAVTNSFMVPTMFHRMLALPAADRAAYDLSSIEQIVHAGAPCPADTKHAMIAWWGPVLIEFYGSTETGMATIVRSDEWLAHPGTVGRVRAGYDVRIIGDDGRPAPPGEPGLIHCKGGQEFGYVGDPRKTADSHVGGYFVPGDIGYLTEDGYLYLCDRRVDMILAGGVNIYPAEIEAVLFQHPAVGDVAVIGLPDTEMGNRVVAVVQPADGEEPGDALAERLTAYCRAHLARYKCPSVIAFNDLPRTESGKLSHARVREMYLP
jgi:long-chain acyl-CoA synthetase